MEGSMSLSFFCDKNKLPSDKELSVILGSVATIWKDVKHYIEKYGIVNEEWKCYFQKVGWCKKILLTANKEERNILFMYPNVNCITCVLVFSEKAVSAAERSNLPENILKSIFSAKQYKEGRSFNVEIKKPEDFEVLKQLIDIKIQN